MSKMYTFSSYHCSAASEKKNFYCLNCSGKTVRRLESPSSARLPDTTPFSFSRSLSAPLSSLFAPHASTPVTASRAIFPRPLSSSFAVPERRRLALKCPAVAGFSQATFRVKSLKAPPSLPTGSPLHAKRASSACSPSPHKLTHQADARTFFRKTEEPDSAILRHTTSIPPLLAGEDLKQKRIRRSRSALLPLKTEHPIAERSHNRAVRRQRGIKAHPAPRRP